MKNFKILVGTFFVLSACSQPQRSEAPAVTLPSPAARTPLAQATGLPGKAETEVAVSISPRPTASVSPQPTTSPSQTAPTEPQPAAVPTAYSGSSGSSGGGYFVSPPVSTVTPPSPSLPAQSLRLDNVLRTADQRSILSGQPDYLVPESLVSEPLALTLQGNFPGFSLEQMRFTPELGLLYQSFSGTQPEVRVLLNDVLLLPVIQADSTHLEVLLPQAALPDLYLSGEHEVAVVQGAARATQTIQLAIPETLPELRPVLSRAEPLENDQGLVYALRLQGRNFLLHPRWAQVQVEQAVYPIWLTQILIDGSAEAYVQIPDPVAFAALNNPWIHYHSPFGSSFRQLGGLP